MSQADKPCWTREEIEQQPRTLAATQSGLEVQAGPIEAFIRPLLARPDQRVILTGAGTSAFIGEALAPELSRMLNRLVEAVPTTDLVSCPKLHLRRDVPTLLVSFGRSGNSPESVAAVELFDRCVDDGSHLVITCNADGALASVRTRHGYVLVLPEQTHDRGFAMTSSFSAMMLAALSVFSGVGAFASRVGPIVDLTSQALVEGARFADRWSPTAFERVVYLGSGVFKGLAREAALKLLELSNGAVAAISDTPMGFRHGPKTFVNDRTLVIVFVSGDPLTRRYDLDMVAELRRDARAACVVTIAAQPFDGEGVSLRRGADMSDVDLLFPFIVPAQLFALAVSEREGLTPDRPNAAGEVNRVVQGVSIYPIAA